MANNKLQILTAEQSSMITMVIEGESIKDIAKKLERSRQTIYDWLNKDYIKAELDRRRQELTRQGNAIILKDLGTYINNIKALANDPSDKRVALAANQYLINRIFGNPKDQLEFGDKQNNDDGLDNDSIIAKLNKLRRNK